MRLNSFAVGLLLSVYFVLIYFPHATTALGGGPVPVSDGPTVRKDERWPLMSSEFGEVSAVKISDGKNGCYYLHFITMNPCSLFLPVYLHLEMLLYVNSEFFGYVRFRPRLYCQGTLFSPRKMSLDFPCF
ncbi:putative rmlC-like jelly roll protein [Helianthus anomalus]